MKLPAAIRSASHPLARLVRKLQKSAAHRREEGLFLVEGPRGVEEAIEAGAALDWVMVGDAGTKVARYENLLEIAHARGVPVQPVEEKLLQRLSPTEHGTGLLGACRLPPSADDPSMLLECEQAGVLVVIWQMQVPGNTGTVIRSAAAFGGGGVIVAGGADPWNAKAVRASAGAIHRLRVSRTAADADFLARISQSSRRPAVAATRGGIPPHEVDWSLPFFLIIGSEVRGTSDLSLTDAIEITIPTSDTVESLSAPSAAAILLSHAWHDRRGRAANLPDEKRP